MALFRYEAVDKTGKVVRGAMNAPNEGAVAQALSARGYAARGIQQAGTPAPAATPPAVGSVSQPVARPAAAVTGVPISVKSVVSAHSLAMFFRQLATMVRAGMPLTQALTETSSVVHSRQLSKALPGMQAAVNAGRSLSGAMAGCPKVFPVFAVSIVWCGELSGKMEYVLEDLATEFEQEASDTRLARIGWGLTKISIVGLVLCLPFFSMGTLLSPVVAEVVGGGSATGDYAVGAWLSRAMPVFLSICLPVSLLLIASWIAWGHIKRIPSVRRMLDGILLRMPSWGNLHRYRSLHRFLRYMDMLYAAGVNPLTAWEAASLTARNNEIAEKLRRSRELANAGTRVTQLAQQAGVLHPEDVALIAGAEKSGDVPATLARLAGLYADRAAVQKTVSRTWSWSILVASQLSIGGVAMIFMASSYVKVLYKLMGF